MADVTYSRVNWEDSPSTDTPINATNLNKMDLGISQVVTRANESMPYANILDDWTDIGAVTTPNTYTADAMRVAELNTNLNGFEFVVIAPGEGGYKIGGADPVIPFSKGGLIPYLVWNEKTWDGGESSISATSENTAYHVEGLRGAYFSSSTASMWASLNATMPQSITVTFKTAKTVSKIELVTAISQTQYTPSAMVFYGSNDGTTWTTLIPSMTLPAIACLQKEFAVSQNKGSYKYYKLTITAVAGGTDARLGGLQLY